MKVADVLRIIDERCPFTAACEWDNSGLLLGDEDWEVTGILVALDVTDEVIDHACKERVDMIVTHHPMIFSPIKRVTADNFVTGRILKLAGEKIAGAAAHTNYDIFVMADLAAGRLGMRDNVVLSKSDTGRIPEGFDSEQGIGRAGSLNKAMRLADFAKQVRQAFGLSAVSYYGDGERLVQRAACCPGSGKSVISDAISLGADVLVTGDIDHHSGIDAVSRGLMIIDAGHYGIEHIFIDDMAGYLASHVGDGVRVITEPIKPPVSFVTAQEV